MLVSYDNPHTLSNTQRFFAVCITRQTSLCVFFSSPPSFFFFFPPPSLSFPLVSPPPLFFFFSPLFPRPLVHPLLLTHDDLLAPGPTEPLGVSFSFLSYLCRLTLPPPFSPINLFDRDSYCSRPPCRDTNKNKILKKELKRNRKNEFNEDMEIVFEEFELAIINKFISSVELIIDLNNYEFFI